MTRILHITPHMGGGVGRALSGLAMQAKRSGTHIHQWICLEKPEKRQFIDPLLDTGCEVSIAPTHGELISAVEAADIVQIEFWNHPTLIRLLCTASLPPMRLLAWCHTSGLHFPVIPKAIMSAAHRFVFTSSCSYEADEVRNLPETTRERLAVISSGGGLEQFPAPACATTAPRLRAGYMGSLNFSKLHPDYVAMLAAVRDPGFTVRMVGDSLNRQLLEQQCRARGRPGLLEFRGYSTDVARELADLDLLIYLLNPMHYGTAEIALLEAMAMGVVPIVMDNGCERGIVEHGVTGFMVRDAAGLAETVEWLTEHPEQRIAIGQRAAEAVRATYTYRHMESAFDLIYHEAMTSEKCAFDFGTIFGRNPADWFRSFVRDAASFGDQGSVHLPDGGLRHAMFEPNKGSPFHYAAEFPQDRLLTAWASALAGLQ